MSDLLLLPRTCPKTDALLPSPSLSSVLFFGGSAFSSASRFLINVDCLSPLGAPPSFIAVPVGFNHDKQVSNTLLMRLYHCLIKDMTRARLSRHPTYAPPSHGHDGSACTLDRHSQVPLQPSYTPRRPNTHLPHASRLSGSLAPISAAGTLRKPGRAPTGFCGTPGTCIAQFGTLAHLVHLAVARRPTLSTFPIRAHLHRDLRRFWTALGQF